MEILSHATKFFQSLLIFPLSFLGLPIIFLSVLMFSEIFLKFSNSFHYVLRCSEFFLARMLGAGRECRSFDRFFFHSHRKWLAVFISTIPIFQFLFSYSYCNFFNICYSHGTHFLNRFTSHY